MNILAEIHRTSGVNINGKTVYRTAVRAVIQRGHELLMVHSTNVGDYKFPGGGVYMGESHQQALAREVREECGVSLLEFGECLGTVIEYDLAKEPEYDAFKMTSYYYLCQAGNDFGVQKLDDYERDLSFEPVWIGIDEAISANRSLLGLNTPVATA